MKRWYEFFRYDIPYAFRACYLLYRGVLPYRAWDWWYVLNLFYISLLPLKETLKQGMEIDETRLPKVEAISRVCEILQHILYEEIYIALAEQDLGRKMSQHSLVIKNGILINEGTEEEQRNDHEIMTRADDLQENEWQELWGFIQGNNHPGSDMRGWWD